MDTVAKNDINVFLSRETGRVSIGTQVDFKSYQIINGTEDEVGRFIGTNEAKSNVDGLVSVKFVADTKYFDKDLPIFIRASTKKDDLSIIYEEIELKIKE
jgi:hypothetical protein